MQLTEYEKSLAGGKYGPEAKQLMEIMLKVAELSGADGLVNCKHVMVGNTGMLSIGGETGINFLTRMAEAGVKFKIPTYTNVIPMDQKQWKEMGIPEAYFKGQMKGIDAWQKMGAILCFSCMPHLCGAIPRLGDHVGYADTAPVILANSYFGAKSNREADVIAIAAGICGRIPNFGYHIDKNRVGTVRFNIKASLKTDSDYDALGYHIGKIAKERVPVLAGLDPDVSMQALIQMGAAMACSGTVALFHAVDITPEIKLNPKLYGEKFVTETVDVTDADIRHMYESLNTTAETKLDMVYIGCPHCTIEKVKELAAYLDGKRVKTELWITASSAVRDLAERNGDLAKILRSGAKFLADTCTVVAPMSILKYRFLATDSAKARGLADPSVNIRFGTTKQCLDAAIKGYWEVSND